MLTFCDSIPFIECVVYSIPKDLSIILYHVKGLGSSHFFPFTECVTDNILLNVILARAHIPASHVKELLVDSIPCIERITD